MDCGDRNRNAHYVNRSGRNMSGGMNFDRSNCENVIQRRNYDNTSRMSNNCGCMQDRHKDKCVGGCDRGMEPVDEMMPGMGFVPWQKWEDVYCIDDGLENGTIFGQLNKPYIGRPMK